jgi:hypothetical protein
MTQLLFKNAVARVNVNGKTTIPFGIHQGLRHTTFSSALNVMISQMVRNESVRFDTHINIVVNYKILRLEV